VPLAAYLAWERRGRLAALPVKGSSVGLVFVAGSLLVLIGGLLGAELFLTRISMIGMLIGIVLFVLGWQHLKALFFPIGVLLLMIPIPTILFNQVLFPLQLLASRVGEASLSAAGIPVLREGNVIILANTKLEVAEACSGIRSLVSLLTLAIVYGYFMDQRLGIRTAIALSAIPVAILANGVRVAGTGFAAHYIGPEAAEGFFHTFSGWLVFVVAFILLVGVMQMLRWLAPPAKPMPLSESAA
jgi:exosortase